MPSLWLLGRDVDLCPDNGTKEMMQALSNPPTYHLFGAAPGTPSGRPCPPSSLTASEQRARGGQPSLTALRNQRDDPNPVSSTCMPSLWLRSIRLSLLGATTGMQRGPQQTFAAPPPVGRGKVVELEWVWFYHRVPGGTILP